MRSAGWVRAECKYMVLLDQISVQINRLEPQPGDCPVLRCGCVRFHYLYQSGDEVLRMQDASEETDSYKSFVYAMNNLEIIWDAYQES